MVNGGNSDRRATATLVALRLGALHAFLRRHGRGGQGWPASDARISGTTGSLADLSCLFYARLFMAGNIRDGTGRYRFDRFDGKKLETGR